MFLYLVRHGESTAEGGAATVLTPRGREQVLKTARRLAKAKTPPVVLWHSPKKRARETAEILAQVLGLPPGSLVEKKSLGPDAEAAPLVEALESSGLPSLLLVSHLPTLQDLVCCLLDTDASPFHFPPAGSAVLKKEKGRPWKDAGGGT